MQLAQLAVGIGSVVVVDTVGGVRRLLNLGQQQTFAQGVDPTGRDKEHVAVLRVLDMENVLNVPQLKEFLILFARHLLFKAVDYLGTLLCFNDIPHLGLAVFHSTFACQRVVGMHLYRQAVVRVNNLDKQRKIVAEVLIILLAYQFAHINLKGIIEGVALKESVGDDRLVVLHCRQRPQLAAVWQRVVVEAKRFYLVAAPYLVLVQRHKLHRI